MKRARAYADAGADLLLVHSKETTQHELEMFSRRWDRKTPLVAVPTTYKEATAAQLAALGFRVLIFANHALRASVKAMRETLAVLRREQYAAAVDDRVVSVEEVCRLVGVPQMKSDEEAYSPAVPENVRAVILAAGYDDRLIPLTADRPKCMLDLKGRTILERQVEALNACGIRDISVVRGYKKERIDLPGLRYFDNDNYSTTGEAVSLYSASEALKGRMLVLYGDVLFEREVLEKLLRSPAPMSVVVDRTAIDGGTGGPSDRVRDLVVLDDPDFRTAKYMTLGAAPRVSRIGQEIAPERADGEFIGLAMFDADATRELASLGRLLAQSPGQRFGEAVEARRASLTDLIQYLIDRGTEVASVDIRGGWM
ncbi:MAG: NTP transferase domain-containing protein, partial [Candidatus Binatia bacterium]